MIVHERDEWLTGYQVASGEGSAWWGGFTFPNYGEIDNLTWHYPGGHVANTAAGDYAAELRQEQAAYHRRTDGGTTGRLPPFAHGYDLGYNAMIDPTGGVWKVRWLDKACAANGSTAANRRSFAIQFMTVDVTDDVTAEQLGAAQELDRYLRTILPAIPDGAAGHKRHADWYPTACPGDVIGPRVLAGDFVWNPPLPILEDKMQVRWRDTRFANVFVLPDGTPVTPKVNEALAGLTLVEDAHDPTLAACCERSWGLDIATAQQRGLLVPAPA